MLPTFFGWKRPMASLTVLRLTRAVSLRFSITRSAHAVGVRVGLRRQIFFASAIHGAYFLRAVWRFALAAAARAFVSALLCFVPVRNAFRFATAAATPPMT